MANAATRILQARSIRPGTPRQQKWDKGRGGGGCWVHFHVLTLTCFFWRRIFACAKLYRLYLGGYETHQPCTLLQLRVMKRRNTKLHLHPLGLESKREYIIFPCNLAKIRFRQKAYFTFSKHFSRK